MRGFSSVVERELMIEDPAGRRDPILVRVGVPRWFSDAHDQAVCPVRIDGLHVEEKEIRGSDPFQALELALAFVQQHIDSAGGGSKRVVWPDGQVYGFGRQDSLS